MVWEDRDILEVYIAIAAYVGSVAFGLRCPQHRRRQSEVVGAGEGLCRDARSAVRNLGQASLVERHCGLVGVLGNIIHVEAYDHFN